MEGKLKTRVCWHPAPRLSQKQLECTSYHLAHLWTIPQVGENWKKRVILWDCVNKTGFALGKRDSLLGGSFYKVRPRVKRHAVWTRALSSEQGSAVDGRYPSLQPLTSWEWYLHFYTTGGRNEKKDNISWHMKMIGNSQVSAHKWGFTGTQPCWFFAYCWQGKHLRQGSYGPQKYLLPGLLPKVCSPLFSRDVFQGNYRKAGPVRRGPVR